MNQREETLLRDSAELTERAIRDDLRVLRDALADRDRKHTKAHQMREAQRR